MQILLTTYKTTPNQAKQIEQLTDIYKYDFALVGTKDMKRFVFNDTILKKFVVADTEFDCLNDVIAGKKMKACIIFCQLLRLKDYSDYIHEAKERLTTRPAVFPVTADWPLHTKFNLIISQMVDSGIFKYQSVAYQTTKWGLPKKNRTAEVINLEELRISYYIYCAGCAVAILTIVIELAFYKFNQSFTYSCT